MEALRRGRLSLLIACIALVAIGISAFLLGRSLNDGSFAQGGPGDERGVAPEGTPVGEPTVGPTVPEFPTAEPGTPDYRDQAAEDEFERPRFSGVVNGIEVAIDAEIELSPEVCTPGNSVNVPLSTAAESTVAFTTSYLPDGAELAGGWAVECQGNYILTYGEWSVSIDDIGAAVLQVTRFLSTNRPFSFDTSEGRVQAGEINGKPAVFILPIIPEEGYGPAGVAILEEFGMTLVTSVNLPLEELILVAEGLQ